MASDEPPELTELVGRELGGRYRLERVLGAGAMGAVFEAGDRRLQRSVAVKVMQPGYARAAEYVERFLLEAQAASKIRHRNVVTVLDHGIEGELVYSVMELLVGQDLEQFLLEQPGQRVGWVQARDLLVQLASGLRAAHHQGVIHRDIKPANCVLTTEDDERVVKVVDFGIAKVSEGPQTQQLTGTGNVLGTASYTAPERVLSHAPATPRSDVYSLGVVAYRMLTGRLPFTGKTSFEVMHHACIEPVPSMREPGLELPAAMEALVLEMLSKKPEQRPADMGEVRNRLLAIVREARDEGAGATSIEVGGSERSGSTSLPVEVGGGERSGATSLPLGVGGGERSGSTSSRLEVVASERSGATSLPLEAGTSEHSGSPSSRLEVGGGERGGPASLQLEVGGGERGAPTSSSLDVREGDGAESTSSPLEVEPVVGAGARAVEVVAGKVPPTELLGRAPQPEPSEPAVEQAAFDPTARVPASPWRKTEPVEPMDRTVVAAAPTGPLVPRAAESVRVEQSPIASGPSEEDRTVVAAAPTGPLRPVAAASERVEQSPIASGPSEEDRTVVAAAPSGPLTPVAERPGSVRRTWVPGSIPAASPGSMEPVAVASSGSRDSAWTSGSVVTQLAGPMASAVAEPSGSMGPFVAGSSGALQPVVSGPPGSMGQPYAPSSIVSGAAGATGREWAPQPVEDAGSAPWMGTVPVADDEPPRSRAGTTLLAYALLGAFVMSVIVGVLLSLEGDDEPSEVATPVTARVEEPSRPAEIEVVPGAPSEPDAEVPSVPSGPDAEAPGVPSEPDAEVPSTPVGEPDDEAPTTPLPEPDAPPIAEEPPATKDEPPRSKKPKKPAGPPSDAELKKALARKIKARCTSEMTSGRATVVFDVTPTGEIKRLTAIPKGAAGECAKRQVVGTRFRARARETNVKIEVTRAS